MQFVATLSHTSMLRDMTYSRRPIIRNQRGLPKGVNNREPEILDLPENKSLFHKRQKNVSYFQIIVFRVCLLFRLTSARCIGVYECQHSWLSAKHAIYRTVQKHFCSLTRLGLVMRNIAKMKVPSKVITKEYSPSLSTHCCAHTCSPLTQTCHGHNFLAVPSMLFLFAFCQWSEQRFSRVINGISQPDDKGTIELSGKFHCGPYLNYLHS